MSNRYGLIYVLNRSGHANLYSFTGNLVKSACKWSNWNGGRSGLWDHDHVSAASPLTSKLPS